MPINLNHLVCVSLSLGGLSMRLFLGGVDGFHILAGTLVGVRLGFRLGISQLGAAPKLRRHAAAMSHVSRRGGAGRITETNCVVELSVVTACLLGRWQVFPGVAMQASKPWASLMDLLLAS